MARNAKNTIHDKGTVITLSTYPPRPCGIATYAQSLAGIWGEVFDSCCESRVIAMDRGSLATYDYPRTVMAEIADDRPESYVAAAEKVNRHKTAKLVHIQHEFGIFGGEYGRYLLEFMRACRLPTVVTFHSILPDPPPVMRQVVSEIGSAACRVTVMTERAKRLLVEAYGLEADKIAFIPHGIPPIAFDDGRRPKAELNLSGRTVLLTFGLMSRGKGIEYPIAAMREIVSEYPETIYLVVGATHPDIVAREGEAYRQELARQVQASGLEQHVRFYNEFVSNERLDLFLRAADIYICTSLDPNQAVSGTLSYALGAGRPVISTAFAQAQEDVTPEVGELVGFRDPSAFTAAMRRLLADPERRARMAYEAYMHTRRMTWPNVALATHRVYAACTPELANASVSLPPIRLTHMKKMTDRFGLIQFSKFSDPDRSSGYTVDDNARALMVAARHWTLFRRPKDIDLAGKYLSFLERAAGPGGSFYAVFGGDRHPLPVGGQDDADALGRTAMACSEVCVSELPESLRRRAAGLLESAIGAKTDLTSPRASAFLVCGLSRLPKGGPLAGDRDNLIRRHCRRLEDWYRDQRAEGWEWFEPCLTYANSILPEALLRGWQVLGEKTWLDAGKKTLEFLVKQTFRDGRYAPIGQKEWCRRGGKRSDFDQQPEDAANMVVTLDVMARVEPLGPWLELRDTAFQWFLGRNSLGQFVYSRATGGCYDSVGEHSLNVNQGAESTVAYLLARLAMEK